MTRLKIAIFAAATLFAGTAMADQYCPMNQKGAVACNGAYQYRCLCTGSYDKPYCAWKATGATCAREGGH